MELGTDRGDLILKGVKNVKIEWNRRYTTIAVYAILVLVFGVLFLYGVQNYREVKAWFSAALVTLRPFIFGFVIAYLLNGASYDKLLFIISDHHQALKRFIIEDLDRSATYIKSKGMYASRDMIFLVVSRKEVHLVQHKIKEIDPAAFVVVTDAYETFGEGFKQFPDKNEIHAE